MKKVLYLTGLMLTTVCLTVVSCKKDENDKGGKDKQDEQGFCNGFFEKNTMTKNFTSMFPTGDFIGEFTGNQRYEVTIFANGNVQIPSNNDTFLFTKDMITGCESSHETNVFYENPDNGYKLILQNEGVGFQLVLSKTGAQGQVRLNYAGPADLSLLAARAGTYTVTSMEDGATHERMTVIINADGTVDFDTDIKFSRDDFEVVFDRLQCCDRIHADLTSGTMNFYWISPDHTALERIEYQGKSWHFN